MNEETTILIVDDNQQNIQVLGNILRDEKYRIAIAQNGLKAIEITNKIKPSLILLDVMMPDMDGFEVCERLKSDNETKDIPIIFLTAKVESEDVVEGFRRGGVDYITKPFKKEELLARVNKQVELESTKQQLLAMIEQKNRIFTIVSHDLRSPVASFRTLLDIILDPTRDFSNEMLKVSLADFREDINSAYNMMNNLLAWAKNEMESSNLEPVYFDLDETILPIIEFVNISAKKKNIRINYPVNPTLKVYADPNMTSTIIRNLLANAVKFSFNDSEIQISVTSEPVNNQAILSIKDFGKGIREDKQDKILSNNEYYTSKGTNNEKGSGIGLKLCKSFAEKNNGKIWFESKVDAGSTFYLSIPLKMNSTSKANSSDKSVQHQY
ncbi:MAG: hybrid sensor histidine kinase/response regulator [Bacteroidales bacterium]|nr:hybrid sensor histidine kinase/response regulator [Bacteroidales bacterium]